MENIRGLNAVTRISFVLALLQSVCTAVLAISGIRLAMGLTAFAMAGSVAASMYWFHQDIIRIPMLLLASIGAIADLVVLSWMKRLRHQPSAQWRIREQSAREKRSQKLQYALAILTLLLVTAETWSHAVMMHNVRAHIQVRASSLAGK